MYWRRAAILLAAALTLAAPSSAAGSSLAGTPVPRGFAGVNVDGPLLSPQDNVAIGPQFSLMRSSGVQSVRVPFSWAGAQPYASWADVPAGQASQFVSGAGGVPTSFAATDQIVALAAARRMTVLPTVLYAPSWDAQPRAGAGLARPHGDQPYAQYMTTLIDRYGPHGTFWRLYPNLPRMPIRMWEVWNEPDIIWDWPTQPFAPTYVALLRAAHAAIKRADPGAKVVLAGMPNFSWRLLDSIYRVHGARSLFDVVDVHPYTKYPAGVIEILGLVRAAMTKAGDPNKPIIAGEIGWPSALHHGPDVLDFETTGAGQARKLSALLPMLAADRLRLGLLGFYWYTWVSDETPGAPVCTLTNAGICFPFNFSGLLGYQAGEPVFAKPALAAFRASAHAIER